MVDEDLFDLRFFVDHMFANRRVVFLGLQLFRMKLLVLRSRIEVPTTCAGYEFDFFAIALSH